MTFEAGLKRRVDRFIGGYRDPRDLDLIFLWMRRHPAGFKTIADIGNFVGHADEKNQGKAWKQASLIVDVFKYNVPQIMASLSSMNASLTFEEMSASAMAALTLDEPANVKKETRVGKRRAKLQLESALEKLRELGGDIGLKRLSDLEKRVFNRYKNLIIVKPAYDEKTLAFEFFECLKENQLIADYDAANLAHASNYLAAYAVEKMHLCKLLIDGSRPIRLFAGSREIEGERLLSIKCETDVTLGAQTINVVTEVFTTTLNIADWTEPNIWKNEDQRRVSIPIELRDGKLKSVD